MSLTVCYVVSSRWSRSFSFFVTKCNLANHRSTSQPLSIHFQRQPSTSSSIWIGSGPWFSSLAEYFCCSPGSMGVWKSGKVTASFVVGGLIISFILWEYVLERQLSKPMLLSIWVLATDPMIPLEVFCSHDVCTVQYASFISGMVMLVMFYIVAIFMTIVLRLSPGQAGVQLVHFAPGIVCYNFHTSNLCDWRISRVAERGSWLMWFCFWDRWAPSCIWISLWTNNLQPRYPIVLGSIIIFISLGLIKRPCKRTSRRESMGM